MDTILLVILLYLAFMNIVGFFSMALDKRKARRGKWRVPEARLFLFALIGGSLGSWLGMYVFRHKTKHWYFVLGMPLIFVLHIVLAVLCVVHFR